MKQEDNGLLDSTINDATHDPEVLEAAQLLLPNGLPHSFANHPSYSTAQSSMFCQPFILSQPITNK